MAVSLQLSRRDALVDGVQIALGDRFRVCLQALLIEGQPQGLHILFRVAAGQGAGDGCRRCW